jgi:hypothetical protein
MLKAAPPYLLRQRDHRRRKALTVMAAGVLIGVVSFGLGIAAVHAFNALALMFGGTA